MMAHTTLFTSFLPLWSGVCTTSHSSSSSSSNGRGAGSSTSRSEAAQLLRCVREDKKEKEGYNLGAFFFFSFPFSPSSQLLWLPFFFFFLPTEEKKEKKRKGPGHVAAWMMMSSGEVRWRKTHKVLPLPPNGLLRDPLSVLSSWYFAVTWELFLLFFLSLFFSGLSSKLLLLLLPSPSPSLEIVSSCFHFFPPLLSPFPNDYGDKHHMRFSKRKQLHCELCFNGGECICGSCSASSFRQEVLLCYWTESLIRFLPLMSNSHATSHGSVVTEACCQFIEYAINSVWKWKKYALDVMFAFEELKCPV